MGFPNPNPSNDESQALTTDSMACEICAQKRFAEWLVCTTFEVTIGERLVNYG